MIGCLVLTLTCKAQDQIPAAESQPQKETAPGGFYRPGKYCPTGFLEIPFGTSLEDSLSILQAKNTPVKKREGEWRGTYDRWIQIFDFSFAKTKAYEGYLRFNPQKGFYKGIVWLRYLKPEEANNIYLDLTASVRSKYQTLPSWTARKDGMNGKKYWATVWYLKTDTEPTEIRIERIDNDIWVNYTAYALSPSGEKSDPASQL